MKRSNQAAEVQICGIAARDPMGKPGCKRARNPSTCPSMFSFLFACHIFFLGGKEQPSEEQADSTQAADIICCSHSRRIKKERIVLKPVPAHVKSFDVSQRVLKNHGAVCQDLGCEVRSFKANPKNGHGQALKGKMERCWEKSGKPSMLRSKYCWRTTSAPKLRIAGLIVTPLDASKSATSAPPVLGRCRRLNDFLSCLLH